MRSTSVTSPGVAKPAPAPATITLSAKTTVCVDAATPSAPIAAVAPAQATTRRGRPLVLDATIAARQYERKLPAWTAPATVEPIPNESVNWGRKSP